MKKKYGSRSKKSESNESFDTSVDSHVASLSKPAYLKSSSSSSSSHRKRPAYDLDEDEMVDPVDQHTQGYLNRNKISLRTGEGEEDDDEYENEDALRPSSDGLDLPDYGEEDQDAEEQQREGQDQFAEADDDDGDLSDQFRPIPIRRRAFEDDEDEAASRSREVSREAAISSSWGKKKSSYYSADTVDYEIESDEDVAKEEEKEARRLQKERMDELQPDDFDVLSTIEHLVEKEKKKKPSTDVRKKGKNSAKSSMNDEELLRSMNADLDEINIESEIVKPNGISNKSSANDVGAVDDVDAGSVEVEKIERDLSSLSKEEKLQLVLTSSPELFGMLTELNRRTQHLNETVIPLRNQLIQAIATVCSSPTSAPSSPSSSSSAIPSSSFSSAPLFSRFASDPLVRFLSTQHDASVQYILNTTFYLTLKAEGKVTNLQQHESIQQLVRIKEALDKMEAVQSQFYEEIEDVIKHPELLLQDQIVDETLENEDEEEGGKPLTERTVQRRTPAAEPHAFSEDEADGFGDDLEDNEWETILANALGGAKEAALNPRKKSKEKVEEENQDDDEEEEAEGLSLTLGTKKRKVDIFADVNQSANTNQKKKKAKKSEVSSSSSSSSSNMGSKRGGVLVSSLESFDDFGDASASSDPVLKKVPNAKLVELAAKIAAANKKKPKQQAKQQKDAEDWNQNGGDEEEDQVDEFASFFGDAALRKRGEQDQGRGKGKAKGKSSDESADNYYNALAAKKREDKESRAAAYDRRILYSETDPSAMPNADGSGSNRRSINSTISANRGLTRARPRDRKNPRTANRHRYEEKMKKRRSQVQEFKESRAMNYGGEQTGIKTHLIKSVKL